MMWYWGSGMHWWGWLLGTAGMVVFWGLVLGGIVALVARVRGAGSTPARAAEDPERILARRFASGEIDAEEYRRRLDTLRGRDQMSHAGH